MRWIAVVLLFVSSSLAGSAQAASEVKILETWPAGSELTLARNQNFYLRLAYRTDGPISIWARPYYQGEPANVGSNPSSTFNGSGEALGWFFLMEPGARVDEIRITAGDGRAATTPVVATLPVAITGGSEPATDAAEPAWVGTLRQAAEAAQRKAYEDRMDAPNSASDAALFSGFMFAVLGLGLAGLLMPIWALARWRGGWRIAAALPLAILGFVTLRIATGVAHDPTSHNLWPFEILQAGAVGLAILGVMALARKQAIRR